MRRIIGTVAIFAFVALAAVPAHAGGRPDKGWKNWFGHFSAGWAMPQSAFGDIADDDWQLSGGATYWPEAWPVGINMELSWQEFGISSKALRAINEQLEDGQVTGGDVEIWQLGVNAMWGPDTSGPVGFYLIGGLSAYRVEGRLTDTGLVYYPPTCDPWWWWCYPGGVGPGTFVKAKDTSTDWGWNGGVGLTFEIGSEGSQVFVEARYHSVDRDQENGEYLPLTVGYRW